MPPKPKPKPDPAARKAAEAKLRAAEDRARRKAMGPPLALSDAALEQLSTIGPADIEDAQAYWRRNAPPDFKALLDAEPYEPA